MIQGFLNQCHFQRFMPDMDRPDTHVGLNEDTVNILHSLEERECTLLKGRGYEAVQLTLKCPTLLFIRK